MSRHLDQQHRAPLRCLLVGLLAAAAAPLAVAQSVAKPVAAAWPAPAARLALNELEYLEMPGLNVMLAHDYYPEGHQGGVGIIQNGWRVATNGDLRLDRTPGQWQPVPKVIGKRVVDRATGEISVRLEYPDESKNRKGFNPVDYPDLRFAYTVRVRPEGQAFRILVDLDAPLPDAWIGKVGFNMELFPGLLFGKTFATETRVRGLPAPGKRARRVEALRRLPAGGTGQGPAPGDRPRVRQPAPGRSRTRTAAASSWSTAAASTTTAGSSCARSSRKGAAKGAVDWLVTPHAIPGWKSEPVVQVSQVGYHPKQPKFAVIELDKTRDAAAAGGALARVGNGALEKVLEADAGGLGPLPALPVPALRLQLRRAAGDLRRELRRRARRARSASARTSSRAACGSRRSSTSCRSRCATCGSTRSTASGTTPATSTTRAWRRSRTTTSTATCRGPRRSRVSRPASRCPGSTRAAGTTRATTTCASSRRPGRCTGSRWPGRRSARIYDQTTVDEENRVVEIHQPDGKPDMLQQIQHGALTVVGGYRALGRFYRGIIVPTLRQYTHLGDFAAQTDGVVFDPKTAARGAPAVGAGVAGLAGRPLGLHRGEPAARARGGRGTRRLGPRAGGYDDALAAECLKIAREIWETREGAARRAPAAARPRPSARIGLAVELLLATKDRRYADYLVSQSGRRSWRRCARHRLDGRTRAAACATIPAFTKAVTDAVTGVPRRGAQAREEDALRRALRARHLGRGLEDPGLRHATVLPAHRLPAASSRRELMLNALNFVLGCHPGPNNAVLRLGRRLALDDGRVRLQPRRLELPAGWQRVRHRAHPSRLPGAADLAVPVAADGVRARRRHDRLPAAGAGGRPPAQRTRPPLRAPVSRPPARGLPRRFARGGCGSALSCRRTPRPAGQGPGRARRSAPAAPGAGP